MNFARYAACWFAGFTWAIVLGYLMAIPMIYVSGWVGQPMAADHAAWGGVMFCLGRNDLRATARWIMKRAGWDR